jgi:opacity protein-like surface antigen
MRKILVSAVLLGIIGSAFADSTGATMPAATVVMTPPTGIYAAVEAGGARVFSPIQYMNGNTGQYRYWAFAWGLNIGYNYALDQHTSVGVEFGYNDNGDSYYQGNGSTGDTGNLDVQSVNWDLLATTSYMWDNGFNVLAKAGVASVSQYAAVSGPIVIGNTTVVSSNSPTDSGYRPMLALGVGYQITPKINIYALTSYIFGTNGTNWNYVSQSSDLGNKLFSVWNAKLGVSYTFGS